MLVTLSGCSGLGGYLGGQGPLGRLIDRPAPQVAVSHGGPSGPLINGPVIADVPDPAIDTVVGGGLREWLTHAERRSLAMASQRAVVATTEDAVKWRAQDGDDATTASGTVESVGDVYRSLRGEICRDVRQSVDKNEATHAQTVTLCREPAAAGGTLWVIGSAD